MPAVRLTELCLDARDPELIGRFWAEALGLQARPHHRPGVVGVWSGTTPVLWLNRVEQHRTGKNRVHLDLRVPEPDRLVGLGASVLAKHADWMVLADPEGNELCAFEAAAGAPADPPARPFAVCVDSDGPVELAAWWAARTGIRPGPGPDGTPRWLPGVRWGPFEIIWKFVPVRDERVAKNRMHWDVLGDPDTLMAAGATLIRGPDDDIDWTVLHDPQGNEFCTFRPS